MLSSAQWQLASTAPHAAATPRELGDVQWMPFAAKPVEGTNLDERDWWYRCTFDYSGGGTTLRFDGLATIAQVWLNGELILESENMYLRHAIEVASLLQPQNELLLCFRSLDAALTKKRPRPRWKTRLVRNQQLLCFV